MCLLSLPIISFEASDMYSRNSGPYLTNEATKGQPYLMIFPKPWDWEMVGFEPVSSLLWRFLLSSQPQYYAASYHPVNPLASQKCRPGEGALVAVLGT